MKARIINNVEEKPNFYEFDGIKLDLQLGMYTVARVKEAFKGGMTEILGSLEKNEVVFFKYETERVALKSKIADYRTKLATMNTIQQSRDMFLKAVRKVIEMEALTAPLVRELIDHIDVYETQGKGKNKTQRVVIHYRFVGYIELPTKEDDFYKSDTRQGVQVSYIPRALPESITA